MEVIIMNPMSATAFSQSLQEASFASLLLPLIKFIIIFFVIYLRVDNNYQLSIGYWFLLVADLHTKGGEFPGIL